MRLFRQTTIKRKLIGLIMLTSSVALHGAPDAFALLASGTADEIKVLVEQ